jgi:formiminoglutamase
VIFERPFEFRRGKSPLLISMPHPGTQLPRELGDLMTAEAKTLPDTDWHIPLLYDFAGEMGAGIISARYSRFLIDLNRPENDAALYTTATTGLYPDILFDGTSIFQHGKVRSDALKDAAKEQVWRPYHGKLMAELNQIKAEHGYAVLFDAHSIRGEVPRLFDGPLPDFNLGTNAGASCAQDLSDRLAAICDAPGYRHVVNGRFKGGHITRHYGQPQRGVHAVQLELAQRTYMDETPPFAYRPDLAEKVQPILRRVVQAMIDWRP